MKFLICGLGSIGQRHFRNLKSLGEDDIVVFRTGKGSADFVERFVNEYKPTIFTDLAESLAAKPDAAFIANPTSRHTGAALVAARAGCHLFIEKPIADSWDGVVELETEIKQRDLVTYIAYNLRFHPLLVKIKQWLEDKELIGRVVSFHAEMAERVTDWHPWEDYHASYACRRDLGGGVVLTQSHEFDYLYWLLGAVSQVYAIGGSLGDLGIEVEDVAKVIMKFTSGVTGSLDIDYLKRPPKRSLEIVTTKGRIFWDYYGKTVSFIPLDPKESKLVVDEPYGFERNSTFLEETRSFIKCVQGRTLTINPLEQGLEVLKVILSVKESLETERLLTL